MKPMLFSGLNEAQIELTRLVLESGTEEAPRGRPTRELVPVVFELSNPLDRLLTIMGRRWSLPLAVGELCWHTSASDEVEALKYYASHWGNFADPSGRITGSCYGKNIFQARDGEKPQWEAVKNLLISDPSSRRAILSFNLSDDRLNPESLDVSCVTSVQFLIRESRLDVIVHMRSNDLIWGLPYDVFLFSMFQEMMALELGLIVGRYIHFAGSMHIYENHVGLADRIAKGELYADGVMPAMTDYRELTSLANFEARTRLGRPADPIEGRYWGDMSLTLAWHNHKKLGKVVPAETMGFHCETYAKILNHLHTS